MTYTFDPRRGVVVVPVYLGGPRGGRNFDFAVDTGATRSCANAVVLEAIGYRRDQAAGRFQARTAGGGIQTGVVRVARFSAFHQVHVDFPVLWLPLPPAARIDGLLGLDFFRGRRLSFDFARGRVTLHPARPWWRVWG